MNFDRPISLEQVAKMLDCDYFGDKDLSVSGLNEIHRVKKGEIVFVDHKKYYDKALNSDASVILINEKVDFPEHKGLLLSEKPFDDFNKLIRHFKDKIKSETTIDPTAEIHKSATIGENVSIGKQVVIYPGAVVMDNTKIGENVIIGPNTVVGSNAFYYKKKSNYYDRLLTCGGVILADNVELGAGCTIDAGVTDNTIIGAGTKIDNQVHIGHDTVIGKNCLFAANVGIAGCVNIADNVTFWGQVGCASDVEIGENVVVLAKSGISKSLSANKTYFGSPAQDIRRVYREMAALRKLPVIIENL